MPNPLMNKMFFFNHGATHVPPAAAAPTVSYVSQVAATGNGTSTATATGVNIGNPAYIGTRRVIVVVSGGSTLTLVTSGTINGVSLDQFTSLSNNASGTDCVEFVSAVVPSGTTGVTIVLNYSATLFTNPVFMVFNVDNSLLNSATPVTGWNENTSGAATNTATVATLAGGFVLAGLWAGGGAGPSITSSTETYTTDYSNSAFLAAHANSVSANASSSVSTQAPPGGGNSFLALAAYR